MYRKKIPLLFLLLFVSALFAVFAISASAATANGRCGKNAYWEYEESTATLKIVGTGKVDSYSFGSAQWHDYCTKIRTVDIASGIINVGSYSFYDFSALTTVNMPDTIGTIGKYAFMYCTSLSTVNIPKSVTTLEDGVFYECPNLREIRVDSENTHFASKNGVLYNKYYSRLIKYPPAAPSDSFAIPNSVNVVEYSAFADCKRLKSISIPNSVTEIYTAAFSGCTSLTGMYIPESITRISPSLFNDCTALQSVILSGNILSIENTAFCNCVSLKMIKIPARCSEIDGWAFYNCRSLRYVVVPGCLTYLGTAAFDECYSLGHVYFGGNKNQWNALNFGERNERYLNAPRSLGADLTIFSCFSDVSTTAWYTRQAIWCAEKGLMSGTSPTTFSPDMVLTRGMFVQILAKVAGVDLSSYNYSGKFSDIKASDWYAKAVQWAVDKNITGGTGDDLFSPNAPVTREQLALFFYAYSKLKGYNVSASASLGQFRDSGQVSAWAQTAVKWAVAKGLISGTSNTTISPKGYATRAQAAVMFKSFAGG